MAVTSATTVTELVNTELINPQILMYAADVTPSSQYLNWLDLRGRATKVGSFPRWILDTATDAGETTDLTTETLETTDVQITAAEVGVRRDITYAAIEESVIGSGIFDFLLMDFGKLLGISLEDDICALFPSLSTSVGSSGTDLSLANMVEAQAQVRKNKMFGNMVYILDDQQASDYQAAQVASTSTTVSGFMAPNTQAGSEYLGTFMNAPVWQTGLCDTANTGANVVGACFVRGDTNPTSACFGGVMTRDITIRSDYNVRARSTDVAGTAKWGVGEINDDAGAKLVTDA